MKYIKLNLDDTAAVREMSEFAGAIVKEHFDPIIGSAQNDYMISKFQSVSAIVSQLSSGYEYYFVCGESDERLGFLAFCMKENYVYLSKFYLRKAYRGKGLSRDMLKFIVDKTRKNDCALSIVLNVNRNNSAVKAYERLGFHKIREEKTDIGGGFFMDDFVYEYTPAQKK